MIDFPWDDESLAFEVGDRIYLTKAQLLKVKDYTDRLKAVALAAKGAVENEGWYSENVSQALFELEFDK